MFAILQTSKILHVPSTYNPSLGADSTNVIPDKISEPLPALTPEKALQFYQALKKEQTFTIGQNSCKFTLLEILSALAPKIDSIELVGSFVRWQLKADYLPRHLKR